MQLRVSPAVVVGIVGMTDVTDKDRNGGVGKPWLVFDVIVVAVVIVGVVAGIDWERAEFCVIFSAAFSATRQ